MREFDIRNDVLVKYNGHDDCVYIPYGVTEIGEEAFKELDFIRYVCVPDTVTTIGKNAFAFCVELETIDLPDCIESIGESAFTGCESLELYVLPKYLKRIESCAFAGCQSLTSIDISENIETLSTFAFIQCRALKMINVYPDNPFCVSWDGILYNQDKSEILLYPSGREMYDVKLLKSVTSIGVNAFFGTDIHDIDLINISRIRAGAFAACGQLETVTTHECLRYIGSAAFLGCAKIEEIELPDGIECIEEETFKDCKKLSWIDIPDSLTEIGDSAFENCENVDMYMSDNIKKIGSCAFKNCSSLSELTISPEAEDFAYNAFSGCSGVSFEVYSGSYAELYAQDNDIPYTSDDTYCMLYNIGEKSTIKKVFSTEQYIELDEENAIGEKAIRKENCSSAGITVYIPASIEEIEAPIVNDADVVAFEVDDENPNFMDIEGVLFSRDGAKLIEYPQGRTDSYYRVPNGVTVIGKKAFNSNSNLTEIDLPDSLYRIENLAFSGCGISKITLPANVANIEGNVFDLCSELTEIRVEAGNSVFFSRNGVLFSDGGKRLVAYPGGKKNSSYKIPESVEVIGKNAFAGSKNLSNIEFPDALIIIESCAFADCVLLQSIELKNSVDSIGSFAFAYCRCLSNVSLQSVRYIDNDAFSYSQIEELNLPEGLAFIGESIADGSPLRTVRLPQSVYTIDPSAFEDDSELPDGEYITFYVPHNSCAENYCLENNRVIEYTDKCTQNQESTDTNDYETYEDYNVTVDLSDFDICDGVLKKYTGNAAMVDVPENVVEIGEFAFNRCESVQSIFLPMSVTKIGECAFRSCSKLATVAISPAVTEIGDDIFEKSPNARIAAFPETYAEQYAQENGIPYKILNDDDDFEINDDNVLIKYKGSDQRVDIPDHVTTIGDFAFNRCTDVSLVCIPSSVESIGDCAFRGCTNLQGVYVPESVKFIDDDAFEKCPNLVGLLVEPDSYAEQYASEHGIHFEYTDDNN